MVTINFSFAGKNIILITRYDLIRMRYNRLIAFAIFLQTKMSEPIQISHILSRNERTLGNTSASSTPKSGWCRWRRFGLVAHHSGLMVEELRLSHASAVVARAIRDRFQRKTRPILEAERQMRRNRFKTKTPKITTDSGADDEQRFYDRCGTHYDEVPKFTEDDNCSGAIELANREYIK